MSSVTGRFAPSPTGDLHLGNLRTAMAAHASARAQGGRFLVRFEDLDRVTSSHERASQQLIDLDSVGVRWDEAPVFQSDRFAMYEDVLTLLMGRGLTYECFCSRREIREAAEAPHGGQAAYRGTCRDLTDAERDERRAKRPPALRLRSEGVAVSFVDVRFGLVSGSADDVVLRRNDGVPAYNLAVVVDDADQGITEVVRGEDLLGVTASQVALQNLLGLPTPVYHHVPLMLGDDGERLAKRHGAVTLADMAAQGCSADEVAAMLWDDLRTWFPYGKP